MSTVIRNGPAWVLIGCCLLMVSGCAARTVAPTETAAIRLSEVPFFPDDTDQCGPSTLASVLAFWGVPVDPRSLRAEIYHAHLGGTLPIDILLSAQAHGLAVSQSIGSLALVKEELSAGRPVLAFLDSRWSFFSKGHYVVVTGYDEGRQGLYMHTGTEAHVFVPYGRFLSSWEKTNRWMLRIAGPQHYVSMQP